MKKTLSKLLSYVMSLAMVFSSVQFYGISVGAEGLTAEQMCSHAQYNLALNKAAEALPSCQEGSTSYLTDGKFTPGGNHAATTFVQAGTSYQIDLGKTYDAGTIEQIVIGYKENNEGDIPVKGYEIQFSANGIDFYTVKKVDGSAVKDACENNNLIEVEELTDVTGAVKVVRLYYPDSYQWGIQATEIGVLDINQDAQEVQAPKCDDAAAVTVSSPDYNTFSYTITAGENQEGYKYLVYLDGKTLVGNGVDAGEVYTLTGITGQAHYVKVVAAYDGKASEGIVSDTIIVHDISELISSNKNVTNKKFNSQVEITEVSSFYANHTITTAQKAVDGNINSGEGNTDCLRTGEGAPQYFVVDLGDYYTPSEFEKVLIGYSNPRTYAANTKIEFSLDGLNYTQVAEDTGYTCKKNDEGTVDINEVSLNKISSYTEKAVRFVKVTLSEGSGNWGYVVNEFSLIADTETPTIIGSNIPDAVDVTVNAEELEKIKYSITAGDNQEDATYVVKFGASIINDSAKAGVEYEYSNIPAGTYDIKVSTLEDGWLSKGISKQVIVDGYINYVNDSLNLVHKDYHIGVIATTEDDNTVKTDPNYLVGSQDISAGVKALNNGVYTDYAHHTGYLQTRPDREQATIYYDLGKDYKPSDIHSIISMYDNAGNAATQYEISFSATGEEGSYEKVFEAKDVKYQQFLNDTVDVLNYSAETVRYIQYRIITGNYAKYYKEDGSINYGADGYHLCELAVMGDESLRPKAPENVTAFSSTYKTINVAWEDIEETSATYSIYANGRKIASNIASGKQEAVCTISKGTYDIVVASCVNGVEKKSLPVSVVVEEEPTTRKPVPVTTTPVPDTTKPVVTETNTKAPDVTDSATKKQTIIKPGKTKITKVKAGKKKISLSYKKVKGAKGYRIFYSTNRKFKKAKKIITTKVKTTIKKLKKGSRYYIKIQAYKVVKGKKVYGSYCKIVRSKKVK